MSTTTAPPDDSVEGPIHVSTPLLLLSTTPLFGLALCSYQMGFGLESPMVVGAIRTFAQLSILGAILHPIFVLGEQRWSVVAAYVLFMVLLASFEASSRSKYYFTGMFSSILLSFVVSLTAVSFLTFAVIIRPTPVWDPQYVIPIVGMLLGNCITGVALAMNSITTNLVEQAAQIELYLTFGATPREACGQQLRDAVRVGATPMLNSMAVIGLISIPGMMTGQILGGSPVMEAARYQMLICYLIAMTSFGTILSEVTMALVVSFDRATATLQSDMFTQRVEKRSFLSQLAVSCRMLVSVVARVAEYFVLWRNNREADANEDVPLVPAASATSRYGDSDPDFATNNMASMQLVAVQGPSTTTDTPLLEIRRASRRLRSGRVLFQNISHTLYAGSVVVISGPSGVGKSQFLRLVASLAKPEPGTELLLLDDEDVSCRISINHRYNPTIWRQQVRHVSQQRVGVPGTPRDFMRCVASFASWRKTRPTMLHEMTVTVLQLMNEYGLETALLDKAWRVLSGGESQRIHLALALASRPAVLLMDESTSALDLEAKRLVEQSILRECRGQKVGVLWISHDSEQIDRLMQSS